FKCCCLLGICPSGPESSEFSLCVPNGHDMQHRDNQEKRGRRREEEGNRYGWSQDLKG
ncbi:hypothetical protein KIL84_011971, partial [Mauremys mutica]